MKKLIATLLTSIALASQAFAAGGSLVEMAKAPNKMNDVAALQNGARLFVNYCMGCHSAVNVRYTHLTRLLATDDSPEAIDRAEKLIKENLMIGTDKLADSMKIAMDPKNAKDWFGGLPPDLSLIARSRSSMEGYSGADYLYTLLRSYYRDDNKATGWNNLAYPNIGMPHPLWEMQGQRTAKFEKVNDHGHEVEKFAGWDNATPGKLNSAEYDRQVADLVGFLQWIAEPAQNQRRRLGVWVLLFIGAFAFIAWRLNAAYWKDIK
jgi:ubiquinol-cytochrome c reductase cytochrome c1 subunit